MGRPPWVGMAILAGAGAFAVVDRPRAALALAVVGIVRVHMAVWPNVDRGLDRVIGAAATRIGWFLGTVAFGLVGILVVVPVGAVTRIWGHDPARLAGFRGWQATSGPMPRTRARSSPWVSALGATATVLVLGAAWGALADRGAANRSSTTALAPALRSQPDARLLQADEGRAFAAMEPDPVVGWRLPSNYRSELVHVVDGHRVTTGSVAGAPVVWLFGGSAAWGSGQRDDHTIASELARLAAEANHPIDIVNWGVFAYTSSQEVALFEVLLEGRPPPDLVVFYDGYNDVAVGAGALVRGLPSGSEVTAPLDVLERSTVLRRGSGASPVPPTADAVARSVVDAHAAAMARARRAAHEHGVSFVQAWQPDAFTTDAAAGDDVAGLARLGYTDKVRATIVDLHQRVVAQLPADAIDLSGTLRGHGQVFIDQVHTNEEGARIVAAALHAALATRIAEAAS